MARASPPDHIFSASLNKKQPVWSVMHLKVLNHMEKLRIKYLALYNDMMLLYDILSTKNLCYFYWFENVTALHMCTIQYMICIFIACLLAYLTSTLA